jgi:hypothetical protein
VGTQNCYYESKYLKKHENMIHKLGNKRQQNLSEKGTRILALKETFQNSHSNYIERTKGNNEQEV